MRAPGHPGLASWQAARLEVFGPLDADSFEGLGLAKALADHLDGAFLAASAVPRWWMFTISSNFAQPGMGGIAGGKLARQPSLTAADARAT